MIATVLLSEEYGRFMGMDLIDFKDLTDLIIRFMFNALILFVLIRFIYYSSTKRKDFLFTFYLLGTTVFLICYLLSSVKLQLGFALGLFAIFGILRYRTVQVPIKEMTYMFSVIGIAVVNSLVNKKVSFAELLVTNLVILGVILLLERVKFLKHEASKRITYEKIELIVPEKRKELIADLETRTGLKIHRVEIGKINFLQDTARIQIYYYDQEVNNAELSENVPADDNDD